MLCHRKRSRWQRSNIRKSWTNRRTNRRLVVSWTQRWEPSTVTSSVRLAEREWLNALVTLVTLSWHDQCSIQVRLLCSSRLELSLKRSLHYAGFIVKVKKILESVCVNCGKLKADIVSRVSWVSSTRFAPHHPIFWGLSPISWRTPNPFHVRPLTREGVLPTGGGSQRAFSVA